MLDHDRRTHLRSADRTVRELDAVVVGAGLSGICAGVTLKRQGVSDFVILAKEPEFGGTWQRNIYPGLACDIPSQLYSFGFHPNPGWSRMFAPGKEIHDYLLGVVSAYDLRPHARFGTEMLDAAWDDHGQRWTVRTTAGSYSARLLILGTGSLHATKLPDIPGIETFQGRMFHSSEWPPGYDGAGDRIAILGTGASSIQITPAVAPKARHVTVLQRTPAWVLPKPDWVHSRAERVILRRVPYATRAMRALQWLGSEIFLASVFFPRWADIVALAARANIRFHIRDRALRKALTPDYTLGCKRPLISNDFYRALNRPNVDLITAPATEIREHSLVAANGTEIEADTIVLATGFHFVDSPIYERIRDRNGIALTDRWKGHPRAYRGTTVSGCPNLFVLWGPNSGSSSGFVLVEAQCRYLADTLRAMRREALSSIEVRLDVETSWKQQTDRITSGSVQNVGGCGASYYLDATGHNGTIWPASMTHLWTTMKHFDKDSYHLVSLRAGQIPSVAVDGPQNASAASN
jgi:cyclohexanone monooxygenase